MSKRPAPPGPPKTDPSRTGDVAELMVEAVGSTILTGGQRLLERMRQTLGDGTPEDGQAFGAAGKQFRATDTVLGAALPTGDWTGVGSDAYAQQNSRQQLRAQSIADTDHEVHRVLAGEAYQVTFHRRQIDELYNWLGELSQYTQWLEVVPRYGEAAKVVVETAAVQTALASAECELDNMHQEAAENATRLRDLVGRYRAIAATALLPEGGFEGPPEVTRSNRARQAHGDAGFGDMGGTVAALPATAPDEGSAVRDTADAEEPAAQRDQTAGPAGLVGMSSMAGVVPAMAAALTTPLAALVAPAGGVVAAVVQAAVQGAAAARQVRDDAGADEDGASGSAAVEAAVPDELLQPTAEDGGTGGSGTATVNDSDTRVPDTAAQPAATGR